MHMLFTLRLSHRDGYLARLAAQSRIFIRLNMSYYEIIIILPLFTLFFLAAGQHYSLSFDFFRFACPRWSMLL